MKRSEYIALGAVGVLVAVTFWPRSSTPPEADLNAKSLEQQSGFETLVFANKEECLNSQILTATRCDDEFKNAEPAALADAPKFDTMDKCTAEFGANGCKAASWNGTSVFVPVLAGMLMARALTNSQAASQPVYPPRTGPASCPPGGNNPPECQRSQSSSSSSGGSGGGSSRRYYSTGSGRSITLALGSAIVDRMSPTRSSTTARGGGTWTTTRAVTAARVAASSSSSTTSRGGFGSTSRSHSSFGS
ncbi:MAG: DUF1190 domain-containing protein [Beijerinckiaceae bacterium]